MNDLNIKIKYIYSRYIIILFGILIFYSLFNIFFFQTEIILLNKWIYELLIPFLLPVPALIFWLRPRLKLLRLKNMGRNDPLTGYLVITWMCIIFPTCIAQSYISDAVGVLKPIKTINDLDKHHPGKFYTIDNYYLDKLNSVVYTNASISGKHSEYLDLSIYVAVPIYEKHVVTLWDSLARTKLPKDSSILIILDGMPISKKKLLTISPHEVAFFNKLSPQRGFELYRQAGTNGVLQITSKKIGPKPYRKSILGYKQPKAWLAWEQNKTLDNKLNEDTKRALMDEFINESKKKFEQSNLNGFTYLAKLGLNNDRAVYTKIILDADQWETEKPIIFSPKYVPFKIRGGNKPYLILASIAASTIIFFIMILLQPLVPAKIKSLKAKLGVTF